MQAMQMMAGLSNAVNVSVMLFHCRYMTQFSHKSKQRTRYHVGSEVKAEAISAAVHKQLPNEVRANDDILPLHNIGSHMHPQSCTSSMLHIMSVASESSKVPLQVLLHS